MALRSTIPEAGRLGGTEGNEILTSAAAAVLTILLLALGVTLLSVGSLLSPHMFIGLALVPPVLLKLASTGYRFVRYYTDDPEYRAKGPPLIWLRMLAPLLVLATILVFASGIALLALGHRSGILVGLHKVAFIVWGAAFGVHFLAYLPRALRTLRAERAAAGRVVPGARARTALVLAAVAAGLGLAVTLLPTVEHWRQGAS